MVPLIITRFTMEVCSNYHVFFQFLVDRIEFLRDEDLCE